MESKANKKGSDENLALIGHSKKGNSKGLNKGKGKGEESTSQLRKKDLSKIKCFICHMRDYYASQCPNKKKGKGKRQPTQATASIETQMNEFVSKFGNNFLMVSVMSHFP